jgi:glycosyltransferase involved in cell wall biosynthesis
MSKIVYCSMTQNRLVETRHCLQKYLPYVDEAVIVDGGSIDDSIFYLRNLAKVEPKLKFFIYPWPDNFSEQRNNYLKHVEDNSWCLVSDPDEWYQEETLKKLRPLIDEAERKGVNLIRFKCKSISLHGDKEVWSSLDNYYKGLLFKKTPGLKYVGNPHEHITGVPIKSMNTELLYEHVKQENVIWHRGARNLFVGGGGPNLNKSNLRWVELRNIAESLGLKTWHAFDSYLLKGNISKDLKDWMIKYHDVSGFDGASEHRELYKLYFRIYHPEEEPPELIQKNIP